MYCERCGHWIIEDERFCPNCGAQVNSVGQNMQPEHERPAAPPSNSSQQYQPPQPSSSAYPQNSYVPQPPTYRRRNISSDGGMFLRTLLIFVGMGVDFLLLVGVLGMIISAIRH